ncbi:MAG: diaminopimelate epimerase [Peptococcaceae bacterium]
MEFTKMHGLGNDFIIVNRFNEEQRQDYSALAAKLCDRHFGIGADGLILVLPSAEADIRMRIFNSDGSEPEMCGNGIRCFAKYVFAEGLIRQKIMRVETLAGIIVPEIILDNDKVVSVKVDMGEPQLERSQIPMLGPYGNVLKEKITINDQEFEISAVSMGNPHCIIFLADLTDIQLEKWGPLLEKHKLFPNKTNVEFVQIKNREEAVVRVWERGAGVTLACGTGACAVLVAGVQNDLLARESLIRLPGGDLMIHWAENNHLYMTGPAKEVFRGNIHV